MCAMKRRQNQPRDFLIDISEAQKKVLQHILVKGAASASDVADLPSSTAQVSMKRLEKLGLVKFEKTEEIPAGLPKKIFGLTVKGFCLGFSQIVLSETITYDTIKSAINEWQCLCPEVLGNWDLLIEEQQGEYSPNMQLLQFPYQVPNNSVAYWVLVLGNCCLKMIWECQMRRDSWNPMPDHFLRVFCDLIVGIALEGSEVMEELGYGDFWDVEYTLQTVRGIPVLGGVIHGTLVLSKEWHEVRALRIERLLEN